MCGVEPIRSIAAYFFMQGSNNWLGAAICSMMVKDIGNFNVADRKSVV